MMKLSLRKRLTVLTCIVLVPLCILVISLTILLVNFGKKYDDVVNNISLVNKYTTTLKENVDYTLYRMIIGGKSYEDLLNEKEPGATNEGEKIQNPIQQIQAARGDFTYLMTITDGGKSRSQLRWILRSLDTLERAVNTIEEQVKSKGGYQQSMDYLESTAYVVTSGLQTSIQEYVVDEAQRFEQIRQELYDNINNSALISIVVLVCILGVSIIMSRKIAKSVTQPIQELCDATEQVASGDFTSPTQIDSGNELQVLTASFNHMKGSIARLLEDVKKEQKKLRVTELRLLQAQINPHFLYNTLDTIMWLAEDGDTLQVVNMVSTLSDFFRTVLSGGQEMITIQEEEAHIRSYLVIQQFRYQDIMEYEITIDPRLQHHLILKLTLQPLVENALYHGIKNKRGGGKILVSGYRVENIIILKVMDNGIGMDEEELEALVKRVYGGKDNKKGSFGLRNVNERIKITFGEEYGLTFESKKGVGTTVTVTLPAQD